MRSNPIPTSAPSWRPLRYAAAAVLMLSACDSAVAPGLATAGAADLAQVALPVRPAPPVLQAKAPAYPAVAIYIVYREYVHQNPGITTLSPDDRKYQQYMEKRLLELYPSRGYAGMMREAVAEAKYNRQVMQQYERDLAEYERKMRGSDVLATASFTTMNTCGSTYVDPLAGADPSWGGQEEHAVPPDEQLPTITMEIDTLQLTGTEVEEIYYHESLATGTYAGGGGGGGGGPGGEPIYMTGVDENGEPVSGPPTRDDLIRAAAAEYIPGEITIQVNPVLVGSVVLGVVAAWKVYRVHQAADRAVQKSGYFYPSLSYSDTKRDAHRHIYFSMMLRRYVGATAAKIITDRHENNSSGAAKVMDLHNNDIGRTHRYSSFRGHWLWDRWDYGEWAEKVRNYINNEYTNGAYIPEWASSPPTTEQAWAREACVDDARYIYFATS